MPAAFGSARQRRPLKSMVVPSGRCVQNEAGMKISILFILVLVEGRVSNISTFIKQLTGSGLNVVLCSIANPMEPFFEN